jgi:hypothetical protein
MPTLTKVHLAGGVIGAAVLLVAVVKFTIGDGAAPPTSISDQPPSPSERRPPAYVSQQPTILKAQTSSDPGAAVSPLARPESSNFEDFVTDARPSAPSPSPPGGFLPAPPLDETLHRR